MKVAIVGSRSLSVENLGKYLPPDTTEIVSGGARGVDTSARYYALMNEIKLTEFLPEYKKYSRAAPLKRNLQIIEYADFVLIFWDGESSGARNVIENCREKKIPHKVFMTDGKGGFKPHQYGKISAAEVFILLLAFAGFILMLFDVDPMTIFFA